MAPTEEELRTGDIGRLSPDPVILDRLEADGHARYGFCEKCWGNAHTRSLGSGRAQTVEYLALLDEVEA